MIELDLGDIKVPLGRGGKYGEMSVDSNAFQRVINVHIYNYGLRQILNDAMADKTDDDGNPLSDAVIVAKAQKRLNSLYAGELRTRGASAEPVDPVEREAYAIARPKVTALLKSGGHWPTEKGVKNRFQVAVNARRATVGLEPIDGNDYIDSYIAANPKIMATAKKNVADAAKATESAGELV